MELKPIRSKKEYQIALAEAERLDVLTMPVEVLIKPYRLRRETDELAAA